MTVNAQECNGLYNLIPRGSGEQIAAAPYSDKVWSLGNISVEGGYVLRKWTGEDWEAQDVGGTKLTVMPNGNPIITQADGKVYGLRKGEWRVITKCAE